MMINGVLNIYKPKGITSFDVVRQVRKITGERKVGHAGTLDPLACGVLPVCIGKSTKIIEYIMENNKTYISKLKLGVITDTYDREGKILGLKELDNINEEQIIKVINSYMGTIEQVPPMYSALKVNGKKLYELARAGIEIERKARPINIFNIEIINIDIPYVDFEVTCSKGTYIRSLCYDIGNDLGCGAVMWELERSQTGPFTKENSVNISEINSDNYAKYLINTDEALNKYDSLNVNEKVAILLKNGVSVKNQYFIGNIDCDKIYRIYFEDTFLGIGMRTDLGLKMLKLLS